MNHISTAVILLELRNRVWDQIEDPEPQYDALLSTMSATRLLQLGEILKDIPLVNPEPKEVS